MVDCLVGGRYNTEPSNSSFYHIIHLHLSSFGTSPSDFDPSQLQHRRCGYDGRTNPHERVQGTPKGRMGSCRGMGAEEIPKLP